MRTNLALKNLTSNPRRLGLGTAGISFAIVLMFLQTGFRHALLDSQTQLLSILNADLIALHPLRYSLPTEQRFPHWLLDRAASEPEIRWIEPMYVERAAAAVRVEGFQQRPIRVIALPFAPHAIKNKSIAERLEQTKPLGTMLVDIHSKPQYGFFSSNSVLAGQHIELAHRRIRAIGTINLGTDFTVDGNLVISPETLAEYFPYRGDGRPLSVVDFGLIRLQSGSDPEEIAKRLTALAPREWIVLPIQRIIERERQFWESSTPIGTIFLIGTIVGFLAGVIVCYQVLFTNIQDSLSELATLKAMGYPNRFFVTLVMRQACYLSLFAFVPALVVSGGLFACLQAISGLPMFLTPERIATLFGLTVAMCIVSGCLSLRKLIAADPASLF